MREGGYQDLKVAPYATFAGEKTTASWFVNAAYANTFQRDGVVEKATR